ncbi:hypothetical protein [Paracoccus lutimaris]|uniref:hypothetical protein n=1 Tax=Paracoccus lutimaris TaxID=1490030 RepID=UPI000DF3F04A|nr:hypothetical protein [Paracoccus lutimaris]
MKKKIGQRIIGAARFFVRAGNFGRARFRSFQAAGRAFIVPAMTRKRHIATDRDAPMGARFVVLPRGLLLLTLR